MGQEQGEGDIQVLELVGAGPGYSQGTGYVSKTPKSQRPLPFPARPGEKITVIDDSNEEWWRVREVTEAMVGHGLSLKD